MNDTTIQTEACKIDCDFHTHTGYSDDCDVPMSIMLENAYAQGIRTLAITDHYDPGYPDPEFPFLMNFEAYHRALTEAQHTYAGKMEVLTGMEIGIMKGQYDIANQEINAFPYDFIIGSFHCLRGVDLYTCDYSKVDRPAMVEDFYQYIYECLQEFDNYDILGHLSLIDRYIGELYDYTPIMDCIDEILKLAIRKGKGLEINTSSFKYGTGTWLPREVILKHYRELGGEILTFGSDAHNPEHYRFHFNDAIELAKSLGFRYYCQFRQRKPEFLTLP